MIVNFLISSYLYYEFLEEGLLARVGIFGAFGGILALCFGLFGGNDLNLLNGIALTICAFSLEENTAFLIRKLKKYVTAKKETIKDA